MINEHVCVVGDGAAKPLEMPAEWIVDVSVWLHVDSTSMRQLLNRDDQSGMTVKCDKYDSQLVGR